MQKIKTFLEAFLIPLLIGGLGTFLAINSLFSAKESSRLQSMIHESSGYYITWCAEKGGLIFLLIVGLYQLMRFIINIVKLARREKID
jgi:uncharacterized membrane protein